MRKFNSFEKLFRPNNIIPFNFKSNQTCAIIGNGGILKGSRNGRRINRYDCVVRMNAAPIKGYEHDVGSKQTFRIINGTLLKEENLKQTSTPDDWIRTVKDENVILGRTNTKGYRNGSKVLSKDNQLFRPSSKVGMVVKQMERNSGMKFSSTGFFTIAMFKLFFDVVDVFGFGFHEEELESRHYWESYEEEHHVNHEWEKEKDIILNWHSLGEIKLYN